MGDKNCVFSVVFLSSNYSDVEKWAEVAEKKINNCKRSHKKSIIVKGVLSHASFMADCMGLPIDFCFNSIKNFFAKTDEEVLPNGSDDGHFGHELVLHFSFGRVVLLADRWIGVATSQHLVSLASACPRLAISRQAFPHCVRGSLVKYFMKLTLLNQALD